MASAEVGAAVEVVVVEDARPLASSTVEIVEASSSVAAGVDVVDADVATVVVLVAATEAVTEPGAEIVGEVDLAVEEAGQTG